MLRRFLVAFGLTVTGLTFGGPSPISFIDSACAATAAATSAADNYAVVIVDTGTEVHRTCISFAEESISGKQALELAEAKPLFKEFSGMGSFVCRLYDTGREVDDCVGDPTYWVYSRAAAGTTDFQASEVGVSDSQVKDGDVEGWKWATEGAPPYSAPDEVCLRDDDATGVGAGARGSGSASENTGTPWALGAFAAALLVVAGVWLKVRRPRS